MARKNFKAMVVQEAADGKFIRMIADKFLDELPEGEVLIRVHYSSLNYKDALSAIGNKGVTRRYPHTPGVDAAGIVEESVSDQFRPGEEVIITGYDLGMNTPGGFSQYIRAPAAWVVKRPDNLSLREAMGYGTAGFAAALSIFRLQGYDVTPDRGEVLVTGATGGVGSLAVAFLAKAGYRVVAATGKLDEKQYLSDLGATEVIHRDEVSDTSGKPLLKGRWAGVVDTVGGNALATAIKSTMDRAAVSSVGLVGSPELPLNVYPFILRGVALFGIDSANCPMPMRLQIWQRIADDWKIERLDDLISECGLEGLDNEIDRILQGRQRGRVVVNITH